MAQKTSLYLFLLLLSTSLVYSGSSWSATNEQYEDRIIELEKNLKKLTKKSAKRHRSINRKFQQSQERLKFNGFLSAGVSRSDVEAEHILGVANASNYSLDAIAGLQANARINDKSEAVLQLVGRGPEFNDVIAEWAYLSYSITPKIQLRMGRLRVPFYVASEYMEVGYAYPWVRPPIDVYSLVPITGYYGMDITAQFTVKGTNITVQAINASDKLILSGAEVNLDQMYGLYFTFDRGPFSLRIGDTTTKIGMDELPDFAPPSAVTSSAEFEEFVDDIIQLIPVLAPDLDISLDTLAEKYQGFLVYELFTQNTGEFGTDLEAAGKLLESAFSLDGLKVEFQDLGLTYDDGKTFAKLESVRLYLPGEFANSNGNYFTVGRRFNKYLPFVQFSHTYTDGGGIVANSIGHLVPALTNSIGLTHRDQKTYAAGLRVDVNKGVALKVQFDHMTSFKGTIGQFETKPAKNPNLLSIVVDAVF